MLIQCAVRYIFPTMNQVIIMANEDLDPFIETCIRILQLKNNAQATPYIVALKQFQTESHFSFERETSSQISPLKR